MTKPIELFPSGIVRMPASKSAAHRAILCAALAKGESRLAGLSPSRDIDATLNAARLLGAGCAPAEKGVLAITGIQTPAREAEIDCAESGSTLRFLLPAAAALGVPARFAGRGRLMARPMAPYACILNGFVQTGSGIAIRGGLAPGPYRLPGGVSSQFVTGLLLALPVVGGGEIVVDGKLESAPYVDMTIEMMRAFGVAARNENYSRFTVPPGSRYRPAEIEIEGDYSQAAFFLAAAALGRPVTCTGLRENSAQGDRMVLDIIKQCGIPLRGVTVDVSDIPDLVPVLAVLFCFCRGESRIINAARLRLKESDRLRAITTELRKLGADIDEGPDDLVIQGGKPLRGAVVNSWNDHRIAMALAVAAVRCEGTVILEGAEAVEKSYPGFWGDFCRAGR